MLFDEIVARLENLSVNECDENKVQVEDLMNISPCLHPDNYLTYAIFLALRKDLPDNEKEAYEALMNGLKTKERNEIDKLYSHFEPVNK